MERVVGFKVEDEFDIVETNITGETSWSCYHWDQNVHLLCKTKKEAKRLRKVLQKMKVMTSSPA